MVRPVLAVALTAVACTATTAMPPAAGCLTKQVESPPSASLPSSNADLVAAVTAGVGAAGGPITLGLAVLDLTTGQTASNAGDQPFYSASISKVIVAVDVLSREVTAADRDRVWRALSTSDDEAMDALWSSHDGVGAIGRVARLSGLSGTAAPEDPGEWGETIVTAQDIVRLHAYIQSLPVRDFIVDALSSAPAGAADGFDQAFGLRAPGIEAYSKQGWMVYRPNSLYLHSTGVLRERYAVALLSVHRGTSTDTAKDRINAITGAVADALPGRR